MPTKIPCEKNEAEVGVSKWHLHAPGSTTLGAVLWLSLFAALFLSCDTGRVVLEVCKLGADETCPRGQICRATRTTSPGQGLCVPGEKSCTPGDAKTCPEGQLCWPDAEGRGECVPEICILGEGKECPETWVCWDTVYTPPGLGTCVPGNTCTLGEGKECKLYEICWDTPFTPPGLGTCVPDDTCTLGDGKECALNEVCWDTAHTPPGLGTCVPDDSCTLDGTWPCPPGNVCQDTLHTPPGMGTCVSDQVSPTPTIIRLELFQEGKLVVPIGEGGSSEGAGWVGAGPALAEVISEGLGSDRGLVVHAENVGAVCQEAEQVNNIQRYIWRCNFPERFAAPPRMVVQAQLGSYATKAETYQVELSAPEVELTLRGDGTIGEEVEVCANATPGTTAPSASVWIVDISEKVDNTPLMPGLEWTTSSQDESHHCMRARLPESIRGNTLHVSANVTATDVAHNTATTSETKDLQLSRIALHMSTKIFGAFMPLAWTDERLVIGSSENIDGLESGGFIYFYTLRTRRVVGGAENVGQLTGLATLGDSGLVAISNDDRVVVVGPDGQLHSSAVCGRNQNGIAADARFPYGPTLTAVGNARDANGWHFAVPMVTPVGSTMEGRILAYIPLIQPGIDNCKPSNPLDGQIIAPLVGLNASEVMAAIENPAFDAANPSSPFAYLQHWEYTSNWGHTGDFTGAVYSTLTHIIELAARDIPGSSPPAWYFWMASEWRNNTTPEFSLMRGLTNQATTVTMGGTNDAISAVALDKDGRAYVVVKPAGSNNYELHRYRSGAPGNDAPTLREILAQEAPVGSPILGRPISDDPDDAEVYVVTTGGTIYAFNANTLELLWTKTLPGNLTIHLAAQPVLKNNQLWIVSTNGELYSVVVNSNGLSQSAQWPKMHHDNCNSRSRHSTPRNMPNCF